MEQLFIFPYNGNGIEAYDCIQGQYDFIGFIDDTVEKQGLNEFGLRVYSRNILKQFPHAKIILVPGSPTSYIDRKKIIDQFNFNEDNFATLIHPKASISEFAQIGKNVLIMAGVVITSNACIEDHVCILPNTVIHHDSIIKRYNLIGSNVTIAGYSMIEENCYIGSGSSIINNIKINKFSLVGMSSTVIKDLPESSKVVGNPSRFL